MTALDEAIARVRSWRDWCAQGKNLYERQELTDAVLLLEELEKRGVAQHLKLINAEVAHDRLVLELVKEP